MTPLAPSLPQPAAVLLGFGRRLRSAGFASVEWVESGFPAWAAAGYPVERGADGELPPDEMLKELRSLGLI